MIPWISASDEVSPCRDPRARFPLLDQFLFSSSDRLQYVEFLSVSSDVHDEDVVSIGVQMAGIAIRLCKKVREKLALREFVEIIAVILIQFAFLVHSFFVCCLGN